MKTDASSLPASLRDNFTTPGSEFRGAPFWAWNGDLDPETCRRQINLMHDAGLGGFFMHSRTGLRTPYLSDRWFECVSACVDEAKKLKMRAWLYDEDRWPSGAAGGLVTSNPRYRIRQLFVYTCPGGLVPPPFDKDAGKPITAAFLKSVKSVAAFTAEIADGRASNVRRVPAGRDPAPAKGESVIFCLVMTDAPNPWYNGQTYLDTLNPEATAKFIEVTHDAYARRLGKDIGGVVPGIFTDEPNHKPPVSRVALPDDAGYALHALAWTGGLPAAFRKLAGYDVVPRIPEIIYAVEGVDARRLRWDFNNCLTELFVKGFVKQIGDWCGKHKCEFTGHMLAEDSLASQTQTVGSCMRCYEYMQAPGIDQLTEPSRIFPTAKQLSSAARQFGKKWRLSETYGCTGWDFPFAGHKAIGDWQLALGVNIRCQHLAWYTMKAQAKRDYPAAVFYQSPWWEFYGKIEDYFGRVNAVMTRGEEVRDILVVHPVESVWTLTDGISRWDSCPATRKLEADFRAVSDRLLSAHLDFDYGDEDIMARHGKVAKGALLVGRAAYKAVVVPSALTLRASTLDLLGRFRKAGGLVVFAGDLPGLVDARPSDAAKTFAASCVQASGDKLEELLSNAVRRVSVADTATGREFGPALYLLREDADFSYLFICNTGETFFKAGEDFPAFHNPVRFRQEACDDAVVSLAAPCAGQPLELDPETGAVREANASLGDGLCLIRTSLPALASRLFVLPKKGAKAKAATPALPPARAAKTVRAKKLAGPFAARLSEANVLVLDHPRYRIGSGEWQPDIDILRLDHKIRDLLGVHHRGGHMYQPWTTPPKANPKRVKVELEYSFEVKAIPSGDLFLAIEEPAAFDLEINGVPLKYAVDSGWWTDTSLRKIRLDPSFLHLGANTLRASLDFSENFPGLEIAYILGNFGAAASAKGAVTMTAAPQSLAIGDWCPQGLAFYAGHVGYATEIRPVFEKGQRVVVKVGKYYGVAVRVLVDGRPAGITAWAPGEVDVTDFVSSGRRAELTVEVIGSRRNSHGALHWHEQWPSWHGPNTFEHYDDHPEWWKEGYNLVPAGLMEPPQLLVRE